MSECKRSRLCLTVSLDEHVKIFANGEVIDFCWYKRATDGGQEIRVAFEASTEVMILRESLLKNERNKNDDTRY